MTKCVHVVGFVDDGICAWLVYGEPSEGEAMWLADKWSGTLFKFCPDCGERIVDNE